MTLEQATRALLAAIQAEDLDAAARALAERGLALRAGGEPTPEVIEAGHQACQGLIALKHKWAVESARLGQFESGFAKSPEHSEPLHDCIG